MTKQPQDRQPEGSPGKQPGEGAPAHNAPDADTEKPSPEQPAAGPHAKPELTNPESAPGTGMLPDPEDPADATDSTSS